MPLGDELGAVIGDNADRFLAPVLQGVQPQNRQRAGIRVPEHAEHPALIVEGVGLLIDVRFAVKAGHGYLCPPSPVASMSLSSARRSPAP